MNAKLPTSREELVAAVAGGAEFHYSFFWGHRKPEGGGVSKSCFSQWWEKAFTVEGEVFPTAEHYMMVRKARLFGDEAAAQKILAASGPKEAKALGRRVHGFSEETWCAHREEIVFAGNLAKFSQHAAMREFLLGTGDAVLVEASPLDTIWGIGAAQTDPVAPMPSQWRGLNLLGFALMKTREQLRAQKP